MEKTIRTETQQNTVNKKPLPNLGNYCKYNNKLLLFYLKSPPLAKITFFED